MPNQEFIIIILVLNVKIVAFSISHALTGGTGHISVSEFGGKNSIFPYEPSHVTGNWKVS
jgi:hypothetical protein